MWSAQAPIVKLLQAHEYAQLLSNFVVKHPLEVSIEDVMNMQPFINKLNKMSICNINKHQKKKKIYDFYSVWYGEDIIMGLLFIFNFKKSHIVWSCEHISLIKMFFHTYVSSLMTFYIEIGHVLEKPR